jgi:hypothetical protein
MVVAAVAVTRERTQNVDYRIAENIRHDVFGRIDHRFRLGDPCGSLPIMSKKWRNGILGAQYIRLRDGHITYWGGNEAFGDDPTLVIIPKNGAAIDFDCWRANVFSRLAECSDVADAAKIKADEDQWGERIALVENRRRNKVMAKILKRDGVQW